MKKLKFFVCENFLPQFSKILEEEEFQGVSVHSFPSLCDHKGKKDVVSSLLQESVDGDSDIKLFCSKYCDALKGIPKNVSVETYTTNYCFSNIMNESMINYFVQKKGYLLSEGWLMNWEERLQSAGFNQESARNFYKEFCNELIFIDSGKNPDSQFSLLKLSEYLDIPHTTLHFELDTVKVLLRSVISDWKLKNTTVEFSNSIADLQAQNAKYAAMLNLISKISTYTNRRETIAVVKEMFMTIFGAQKFTFWTSDSEFVQLPEEFNIFLEDPHKNFILFKELNRICISIKSKSKFFGVFDFGDFLFPQYIDEYLNLALEIAKICALVLSNIEQYELLQKSEQSFEYLSFHDSMTKLKNRAYINHVMPVNTKLKNSAVFVFDIDKLKYVNDVFGHQEGDQLICLAADVLKECFRETDIVARIGGDEFIAIVVNCDQNRIEPIIPRINEIIELKNRKIKDKPWKLSISMGVAFTGDLEIDFEKLAFEADQQMYDVKNLKKTQIDTLL